MFDDSLLVQGPKKVASGEKAMVATQHPEVTKAMVRMLKDGGNAVDAIIMSCLLQNVYEPHMSNHAGTVDFLYYEASTGKRYFLNGVAELPEGMKPFAPNPHNKHSCTIPGFAPSLAELHKRFGTLEWSEYCEPAVKAAEEGTMMTSFKYACLYGSRDMNTYFPSSRRFYYPNGFLVPAGHRWKRPNLAKTLRRLSEEGPEYFITGDWAKHFVEMSNEIGWKISLDHLKAYEPRWMEPLEFIYKEYEVLGSPPPDTGGLMTAFILGVLEELNLNSIGHYTDSGETLYNIAWVQKFARKVLIELIHDPLSHKVPSKVFLLKEFQKMVAEILEENKPLIDLTEDLQFKTSNAAVMAGGLKPSEKDEEINSCHNVVRDAEGNWVTMMHTGNGGGIPGLVVDGVSMMGGSGNAVCVGNGRRIRLPICPIMVLNESGIPFMALGTPGNPVYSTPIVMTNMFEFDMEPNEAVDAPRFWSMQEVLDLPKGVHYTVEVENRISEKAISELAKLGVQIKPLGTYRWNTGSFQIVWEDKKSGLLKGTSDPRRLGSAEGY